VTKALLLVTTSYPDRADGSEAAGAFVADLADALSREVPVRVVAPGAVSGQADAQGNLQVWRYAAPGKPLSLLSPARPSDWPAIARTLRALRQQVLAAAGDGQVGHVLALWVLPSGWAAAVLRGRHGIPYSVWALGSDIWSIGKTGVGRTLLRWVMRRATHCYADGLQLAQDAARIGGRPFVFLPSTRRLSADRPRTLAERPPYRLLFLGRWHPNKGIDLLLDALGQLKASDWSRIAEVRIAGGGQMEDVVRSRAALLQAAGHPIALDGYLDRDGATRALANADWLLLPSRIESIPVVFSDAMKMQLPVIAMPVGDLPALFADDTVGCLAQSVDARAFAAAISRGLQRRPADFAAGMARCGKRFAIAPRTLLAQLGLLGDTDE
jgi:glycosyltransferase involved in cell wall biosynthesis